ncbi:MAG: chemotaxis protein CheW [Proteobacteria bacterium]|nr:chemotaxis protein CheW [Pseudomonadota bacterium]MBU0965198.1 chemotaxis protein CheW [Pseudomonadota bacterium]
MSVPTSSAQQRHQEEKYLTFYLNNEEYGIPIHKVKEIIGMTEITAIPQQKQYYRGVINLRDRIIPVLDLRLRLNRPCPADSERTCIIVVEVARADRLVPTGMIVDSVSEVLQINEKQVENTANVDSADNSSYLLGVAKVEGKVKILIDIDRIVDKGDLQALLEKVA